MNRIYQKEVESAVEYTLPDYMGDVKKILTVSASTVPSGKFVGESSVTFSGIVNYDILYADSEGKLTRINTTSDYDIDAPITEETYNDSSARVHVANMAVRLSGPRKLTAKAILSLDAKISETCDLSVSGDAFAEGNEPELLTRVVRMESIREINAPEREYAEEAERLPDVQADDVEIIATSGAVKINEATVTDGGVLVKGEIILTSIVRTKEQPPFAIRKSIPFEETVSAEGIPESAEAVGGAYLTSVTGGVADTEDGCSITVNAIAELYCMLYSNEEITLTKDAYLKRRDTSPSYSDFSYTELVSAARKDASVSVSASRDEIGCENIRNVLTLSAEVRSVDKKMGKGSIDFTGDILFSGIACEISEENIINYVPLKFARPFAINVNCGCQIPDTAACECEISVPEVISSLDMDRLNIKCEASVLYSVTCSHTTERLTECNIVGDETYDTGKSCITLYYPDARETLFDIAKRFHTTVSKIAEDNSLSTAVFNTQEEPLLDLDIKKLIIK